jgi:hypothetical protein
MPFRRCRIEIARPFPGRDGEMDLVLLGRDAERFGAAPGDRPDVGVLLIVLVEHKLLGRVDLGHRVGNLEVENLRRILQPFGVLGALENLSAIGAFALEHAACVMQAVGQHTDLALGGGNELAVQPDQVRTLVEGHGHGILLPRGEARSVRLLPPPEGGAGILRRDGTPGMVSTAPREHCLPVGLGETPS